MNILLIGGTGVLSSAVTKEALKKEINVTMINRGRRTIPQNINLIKTDCTDFSYIKRQLEGKHFDAVIDFLCMSEEYTLNSINLYKEFTNQYIFISSCAVYDTSKGGVMVEDSSKILKIWDYSVKKWNSELKVVDACKQSATKYTIIRPCLTYGDTRIPYGVAPRYGYHWTLAARILAGKPILTWNHGQNRCNMIRVEDFAVGVVGLIGNKKAYNEAFNICGDETPAFMDVINILSDYLGKKAETIDVPPEFYSSETNDGGEIIGGRAIDAINSNAKIKRIVPEFKQNISLNDGIRMTLDSYKTQNYQNGIDWDFDAQTDRVIKRWCKSQNIDMSSMKLGFVDYNINNKKTDCFFYWLEYYKEYLVVKGILYGITLFRKIKNYFI